MRENGHTGTLAHAVEKTRRKVPAMGRGRLGLQLHDGRISP